MNILIPIVGRGTRVKKYKTPKPLILVNSKPIIQHCIESLNLDGNYIFIVRKYDEYAEFSDKYTNDLKSLLLSLKPNSKIIEVDYLTEGPASSALLAKDYINNDEELLITNCDQRTDWDSNDFIEFVRNTKCDGCVTTYPHPDIVIGKKSPYSFIEINENGMAVKLEEKFAISEHALNGIHYCKAGKFFVESAEEMISQNDRINNEFYISKTYNYLIKNGKNITSYKMLRNEFYALGNVEEIERFLKNNENL